MTLTPRLDQIEKEVGKNQLLPEYMTATSSTPTAGQFYSEIKGRAPMIDLSKIPAPKMGIERIDFSELEYIAGETDASGKTVSRPKTDALDRIRFVGNWVSDFSAFSGRTILSGNGNSDSYIEVTFYGTGLRFLTPTNAAFNYQVSVDGGANTTITESTVAGSTVINNRSYEPNNGVTAVKGLTLGLHTIRISKSTTFDCRVHGFEILNESTQLSIPAGNIMGDAGSIPATTTDYNTGFDAESDALGTKGGHVVVYSQYNATTKTTEVKKRFKATDITQQNLSSADHSNEELIRKINWREFGVGSSDDFSTLGTSNSNRNFTLDDGTTTLIGGSISMEAVYPDSVSYVGPETDQMKEIAGWDKTSARLVKAIQELSAKVDALEAQIQ